MSKKTNNDKVLEVRFVEPVNSEYFEVIKFFDKIYKNKKRSDSISWHCVISKSYSIFCM